MSEGTPSINSVKEELGKNAVDRIRQAFNVFDQSGDEAISSNDLKPLLKMFNFEPSEEELGEMIKKFESSEGIVKYEEFVKLASEHKFVKEVVKKKPPKRVQISNDEVARQFVQDVEEDEESTRKWLYEMERGKEKTAAYVHCGIWSMIMCCCLCWCPLSLFCLPCMCCCALYPFMKMCCCRKCKCHGKDKKEKVVESTPLLRIMME